MRFSKSVKSSLHCLPSPDGKHIATLFPSVVNVRAVRNLEVVNVVKLPQDLTGPILAFQWSPSSRLLLVANATEIRAFSALDDSFNATIRNPVAAGTKPVYVGFGGSDVEVFVVASFGLKFAVYDLGSSKAVEIPNPKASSPSTASRCFSLRPQTRHLALMTRAAGKDIISIHGFPARELQRSWAPDTIDAQGLVWSPDGKWLIVWESAAHGHKLLFYTSDGHIFRTWSGPANPHPEYKDYALGAGIKTVQFSADGRHLAIGDHSRFLYIFGMSSLTETMRLCHPNSLTPRDTLQIWQEQVGVTQAGPAIHTFLRASHVISPPTRPDGSDLTTGCVSILFEPSSSLVATRLDESPGTIWIWDVQAGELRAVLLFHGSIVAMAWHPETRETLLVRCDGDDYKGIVFVWDPLSEGPQSVDFGQQLPGKNTVGRTRALWLSTDASSPPSLFLSDAQNYVLASLVELDQGSPPWGDHGSPGITIDTGAFQRDESPLELVPAVDAHSGGGDDSSELEDTFIHKR
ncbi:hypothetical protein QBC47DRAFT_78049 [Echria macrotheca]|uniref:WD40 domain-containing protein n=1 Tax=Echria macrotheca TaxID=438768 RepID=A0AAJ0B626_9PEZI|nr:hypothetical protein QBC47DRAFT_78049 [Echria macrotheca]